MNIIFKCTRVNKFDYETCEEISETPYKRIKTIQVTNFPKRFFERLNQDGFLHLSDNTAIFFDEWNYKIINKNTRCFINCAYVRYLKKYKKPANMEEEDIKWRDPIDPRYETPDGK